MLVCVLIYVAVGIAAVGAMSYLVMADSARALLATWPSAAHRAAALNGAAPAIAIPSANTAPMTNMM